MSEENKQKYTEYMEESTLKNVLKKLNENN